MKPSDKIFYIAVGMAIQTIIFSFAIGDIL